MAREELNRNDTVDSVHSERYLELALTNWLPTTPLAGRENGTILARLAAVLEKNHGDSWLVDFLSAKISFDANRLLLSAAVANRAGDPERAFKNARLAKRLYSQRGNSAGEAWSQFEILYALHRETRSAECGAAFREEYRLLRGRNYRWLKAQSLTEASICGVMAARFASFDRLTEATHIAQASSYVILTLRCLGIQGAVHTDEGRLLEAWRMDVNGAGQFWSASYPDERGFQFYSDLEFVAEEAGEWHTAAALESEAIKLLDNTTHLDVKAIAYSRLGAVEQVLQDFSNAHKELETAHSLFQQLPATISTKRYEADTEISLAYLEARYGSLNSAEGRLEKVRPIIATVGTFRTRLPYFRALALIQRYRGNTAEELSNLRQADDIARQGFQTITAERDRWDWLREVEGVQRRLIELELEQPHDPGRALADWEAFRALQLVPSFGFPRNYPMLIQQLTLNTHDFERATLLSFAALSDQITVWVADNRGVREFQLQYEPTRLAHDASLFTLLCSDPGSSIEKVKVVGFRLYRMLLKPFAAALDPNRTLVVQGDGILGLIPWYALTTDDGAYLGQRYRITNMSAPIFRQRQRQKKTGDSHVLVVSPSAVSFEGIRYQPLVSAVTEGKDVAAIYPSTLQLNSSAATLGALLNELPRATIFHFSGHAVSNTLGGGLIVHGSEGGTELAATDIGRLRLKRMELVVLSACSTAFDSGTNPNGLPRSFLSAGASYVVASRWNVDSEATAELMRDFHARYRSNNDVAEALFQAINEIRKTPTTGHPYYWASFEVFQ